MQLCGGKLHTDSERRSHSHLKEWPPLPFHRCGTDHAHAHAQTQDTHTHKVLTPVCWSETWKSGQQSYFNLEELD